MANDLTKPEDYSKLGAWATTEAAEDRLFFKKGKYTRTPDATPVALGTKVLVHVASMSAGFVKWEDSKPVDTQIAPLNGGVWIHRNSLGDTDQSRWPTDERGDPRDPWARTMMLACKTMQSEALTFTTSSAGGRNALAQLAKAFALTASSHPGQVPIVELGAGTFKSDYGEIDKPKSKIVGWADWERGVAEAPKLPKTPTEDFLNDELPPAFR